jgi:hypothetical protein
MGIRPAVRPHPFDCLRRAPQAEVGPGAFDYQHRIYPGDPGASMECEASMPWQKPKRAWSRTRDTMIVASLFVLVGVTLWFLYVTFFPEWVSK